jgi:hypothetical protein
MEGFFCGGKFLDDAPASEKYQCTPCRKDLFIAQTAQNHT